MRAWITEVTGYHLPDGLHDEQPVTVVPTAPGEPYFHVTVEDAQGRRFSLYHIHVDVGREYQLAGLPGYYHESDPRTIAYLFAELARGWSDMPESNNRSGHVEALIKDTRHVLQRNGYDPDGPAPVVQERRPLTERERRRQAYFGG
jgi:hypothetical protein